MAPVKKQSLLPLSTFIRNPKKSTMTAHKMNEKKNGLADSPMKPRKKPKVDKKAVQRLKEEKAIAEGGKGWLQYMNTKGFDDVERHDPCLLFQVYGAAPDPNSDTSSSEDEYFPNSKNHPDNNSIGSSGNYVN